MDGRRFDEFTRAIGTINSSSRRRVIKALAGGTLGGLLGVRRAREAAAACKPVGAACAGNAACCTQACVDNVCCRRTGAACSPNDACCGGRCLNGRCCKLNGQYGCTADSQCCMGNCSPFGDRCCPPGTEECDGQCCADCFKVFVTSPTGGNPEYRGTDVCCDPSRICRSPDGNPEFDKCCGAGQNCRSNGECCTPCSPGNCCFRYEECRPNGTCGPLGTARGYRQRR